MSTTYTAACVTCEVVDKSSRTYNPELVWGACIVVRAGVSFNASVGELDLWWLGEHLGHDVRVLDEYGSLSAPVPLVELPPQHTQVTSRRVYTHWVDRDDTPEWTKAALWDDYP